MNDFFVVEKGEDIRLDMYLTRELDITRSYVKKLIDRGDIKVNGATVKCGYNIHQGDIIKVNIEEKVTDIVPENIPLDILYEDDDIAVINKQQGISVHPASGNYSGTLVNALLYHLKDLSTINGVVRPGIVHRLDKDTSGVMVVAKNDKAHLSLSQQIADRSVVKLYRAVLEGNIKDESGTITTNIGRSPRDRKIMAVVPDGRLAITDYSVLERFRENCFVQFRLHTGRTHQIRVHAKYMSHPVVGDKTYGYAKQRFNLDGQLLHSYSLTFCHPVTGQSMTFVAQLPPYFERVLTVLRSQGD